MKAEDRRLAHFFLDLIIGPYTQNPAVVVAGDYHLIPIRFFFDGLGFVYDGWSTYPPPPMYPPRNNCFI